jgi:hypothetical protein
VSNRSSAKGSASASPCHPLDLDAGLPRQLTAGVEQLGHEVERGDAGARLGGRDGRVAGARGDVEDLRPRLERGAGDGHAADVPHERLGDGGVVTRRPGGAVGRLELDDLGGGGGRSCVGEVGHQARSFQKT